MAIRRRLTDMMTVTDRSAPTAAGTQRGGGGGGPSGSGGGGGPAPVVLAKGRSQLDWMKLVRTGKNMNGLNGAKPGTVSGAELKRHRTQEDAWVALNGIVYDVTRYLEYHPGGVKILAAVAGKDCTKEFERYHKWVNGHAMLRPCAVGVVEGSGAELSDDEEEDDDDGGC